MEHLPHYEAQYQRTRDRYAQEFGEPLPRNIWQHLLQPEFGGLLVMVFYRDLPSQSWVE